MDADGQAMAVRRRIDRPMGALAKGLLAHGQHQHLHEARIARPALDLLGGEIRVVQGHNDGGAQARVAVQPFRRDPVVDGGADHSRHILAMEGHAPIDAIGDGGGGAEEVEMPVFQDGEVAARAPSGRAPVGADHDRRIGRIARHVPADSVDAARDELLAPVAVEIGQQRLHGGHGHMHVAIHSPALEEAAAGALRRSDLIRLPGHASSLRRSGYFTSRS